MRTALAVAGLLAVAAVGLAVPGVFGDFMSVSVYDTFRRTTTTAAANYPLGALCSCGGLGLLILWAKFRRGWLVGLMLTVAVGGLALFALIWVVGINRGALLGIDSPYHPFVSTAHYGPAFGPSLASVVLLFISAIASVMDAMIIRRSAAK